MKKTILLVILILATIFSLGFCLYQNKNNSKDNRQKEIVNNNLIYKNEEFGFTLYLTKSWEGYTATSGPITEGSGKGTGFEVVLRNPNWTEENPTMDIPIQIFTKARWSEWESNNFATYPTAAPIGPTKRGENENYVFATAPRYNYSFLPGYEEVENIIKTLKDF
ncbi:MAG: hypothetical protein WC095_00850 [Candidatus Paceibacterota bacterium]